MKKKQIEFEAKLAGLEREITDRRTALDLQKLQQQHAMEDFKVSHSLPLTFFVFGFVLFATT
jgi:hypothetical protein